MGEKKGCPTGDALGGGGGCVGTARWSGRPSRPAEPPGVGSAGRHHRRAEPPEPNRPSRTTAEGTTGSFRPALSKHLRLLLPHSFRPVRSTARKPLVITSVGGDEVAGGAMGPLLDLTLLVRDRHGVEDARGWACEEVVLHSLTPKMQCTMTQTVVSSYAHASARVPLLAPMDLHQAKSLAQFVPLRNSTTDREQIPIPLHCKSHIHILQNPCEKKQGVGESKCTLLCCMNPPAQKTRRLAAACLTCTGPPTDVQMPLLVFPRTWVN